MPHLHRLAAFVIACAVVFGMIGSRDAADERAAGPGRPVGGTASAAPSPGRSMTATDAVVAPATGRPDAGSAPPAAASAPPAPPAQPGPASVAARQAKANELGQVPVLMYHRIVRKDGASLDRTVDQLRGELTRLAREGYVPITAAEFVEGRIDIPAGRHPVVLTFDDGTPGHFSLDAQGGPAKDTAVAVLMEVAAAHPGFRPVATFYVNREPFALGARAAEGVRWLISHGFEVANHTASHADLSRLKRDAVRKEIGDVEAEIVALAGSHSTTLAYPFGAVPAKSSWARSDPGRYSFKGIFLAGWRPSVSPFDRAFDPYEITRVRSEGRIAENDCKKFCSTAWLDYLKDHPEERYTSDGDPSAVTFPEAARTALAGRYRDRARTY